MRAVCATREWVRKSCRLVFMWGIYSRKSKAFCECFFSTSSSSSHAFVVYWVSLRLFRFLDTIKAVRLATVMQHLIILWNRIEICTWNVLLLSSSSSSPVDDIIVIAAAVLLQRKQLICFMCGSWLCLRNETESMVWNWDQPKQRQTTIHRAMVFTFSICGIGTIEWSATTKEIGLFVWWNRHPRVSCQSIWPRQYLLRFCFLVRLQFAESHTFAARSFQESRPIQSDCERVCMQLSFDSCQIPFFIIILGVRVQHWWKMTKTYFLN